MKELSLQNTRLDGRYDVLRLLGRGSYAEIFLARDNAAAADSLHKFVVIKALNVLLQEAPDADLERTLIENFQNEAFALDKVRHPNVINRLGHGTARDLRGTIFHYLVLEYLSGGNLSEMCRNEPLSFERTLFYLEQVCAGLRHAHEQGVIHRDIKPQNLLLTEDRQTVKIADFGVARFAHLDSPITRVGTNVYAAPEHSPSMATVNLANSPTNRKLTPSADIYSLAKTVYSVMFCESPRKFANAPVTELPEKFRGKVWADDVLRILERATQINPPDRFQTVQEFWEEFASVKDKIKNISSLHQAAPSLSSLEGFVPQAPARPSFSSLPNVQIAAPDDSGKLFGQSPKIVVELNKTQKATAAPQTAQTARQDTPPSFLPSAQNGASSRLTANQNSNALNQPQTEISENAGSSRLVGFFKRLTVAALLLVIFSGVLYGTFLYLQNRGILPILPSSINIFSTPKAVANKDAWLRSSPAMGNNQIGIVTEGSELKVYGKSFDGNWYEVEIIKQGQPDKVNTNSTRGWIGRSIVDLK